MNISFKEWMIIGIIFFVVYDSVTHIADHICRMIKKRKEKNNHDN